MIPAGSSAAAAKVESKSEAKAVVEKDEEIRKLRAEVKSKDADLKTQKEALEM